ncbi:unnamed protein product [Mucor hiemalis]
MFTWSEEKEIPCAIFCTLACALLIYRELSPKTRLNYSKFTNTQSGVTISSKYGMLIIYAPSMFVAAYSLFFAVRSDRSYRILLIAFASFAHYLKRVYEVMRVLKYSGVSKLMDNIAISVCYVLYVLFVRFFSDIVKQASSKVFWLGFVLFFTGEYVNYYHHCILSRLRQDGSKEYKIPNEGLFKYLWCPHYTGEITSFIAIALMSQHYIIFIMQIGSAGYLATRAYNTRLWYQSKFDTIPTRACLIPGLF